MSNELTELDLDQVSGGAQDRTAVSADRSKPGAPANNPPPPPPPKTKPPQQYIDPEGNAAFGTMRKIPSIRF